MKGTGPMEKQYSSAQEIEDLIRARYVLLYVVSPEEDRVAKAIAEIGDRRKRKVIAWSCTEGLKALDESESYQDIKCFYKEKSNNENYKKRTKRSYSRSCR